MAKGVNKTATGKVAYIGPFYPFGHKVDAYNLRGLTPREWDDATRAYWIGVEPKIAAWFTTDDTADIADDANKDNE